MIVFFFFKCVEYTCNAAFERATYPVCRQFVFIIVIFYYCVCQLISSSNWLLETVCCNTFFLFTLIFMSVHMRYPES